MGSSCLLVGYYVVLPNKEGNCEHPIFHPHNLNLYSYKIQKTEDEKWNKILEK